MTCWCSGSVNIRCGGEELETVLKPDEDVAEANRFYFDEKISHVGKVHLTPGEQSLSLELINCNREDMAGLCVSSLEFKC